MLNKVLGTVAFGRASKRSVTLLLLLLVGAIGGLAASSSFAATGVADPVSTQTRDLDGDGHIDAVLLTFATPMNASSPPTGYTVDGFANANPSSQWQNVQAAASTQLLLKLLQNANAGDTGVTPAVHYTAGGANPSKSLSQTETGAGPFPSTDGAGPVLMGAYAKDINTFNTFNETGDAMRFVFSEPVSVKGQTAADRVKSLDLAIVFAAIKTCGHQGGTADPTDANASNIATKSNFPGVAPNAANPTPTDPIIEPAAGSNSRSIRVVQGSTNQASSITNIAIPLCGVGIDGTGGASGITDVAPTPNNASSQDIGGPGRYRRPIQVADSAVRLINDPPVPAIYTQDLGPGNGDGYVDAVKVQFDRPLIDSTISDALASRFTVSANGVAAAVSKVETGTANDDALIVRFNDGIWGGGIKPVVTFDNTGCIPDAPSPGLKAQTPTAGYFACAESFVGSSALPSLDGVPPAVTGSTTSDSNANGLVDHVTVNLTEAVAGGATKDGWSVNGSPAADIAAPAGATSVQLAVAETPALGSGSTPDVAYDPAAGTTTDTAGAELKAQTFKALDASAPRLVKATALSGANSGSIDRVTLQFSEPVADSTFTLSSFSVDGVVPTGVTTSALDNGTADDNLVTVSVTHAGTMSQPVAYTGTFGDMAVTRNVNTDGFAINAADVIDGAAPVVTTLTTNPAGTVGAQAVTISAELSELADGSVAPTVKVGTAVVSPVADADHNAQGFRTADLSKWDGTITFSSADCADQNGCVKGVTFSGVKDRAGNTGIDATPATLTVDTVAPDAATAETATAIQEAGASSIPAGQIGGHTQNLHVTAAITPAQINAIGAASGGSAELLLDGASFSPALTTTGIAAAATEVSFDSAYADAAALRSAISEGTHTLKVRLCDSAANCATSAGTSIVADYSPVTVSLASPNAGSFSGGDTACIQYQTDSAATDWSATELRYSTDGGSTYPNVIATGLPRDGAAACGVDGGGYQWTVPALNTSTLRVAVRTIDTSGNESTAASASNMTVSSIIQTALTLSATPTSLVYGPNATLSGTLTGNGTGVAGKAVQIQRQANGSSTFSSIGSATTGSDGTFSYVFKPTAIAGYRAVFVKTGQYLASTSPTQSINVAVAVPSTSSATTLRPGDTFSVRGSVQPAKPGKYVWFQYFSGGKWVTLAKQTFGSSSSNFAFSYRSTTKRQLLFRVAFPTQDNQHAWNTSTRYLVTWK